MASMYSAAVFLVMLTFIKSSFTNPDALKVRYSRDPVRGTVGQSLTLKCTVEYDIKLCLGLRTSWCLQRDQRQQLTNPDKYLIRINETEMNAEFRQRDVFIIFYHLFLNDAGLYQCVGECADPGPSAMGHLINVTVTENEKENLPNNGLNMRDRGSTGIILLILTGFILPWI